MDTRPIYAILFACLLATGCRQDPYLNIHVEMLNAEKRALEDQVYSLQYDYEAKEAEVERLQDEVERLSKGRSATPEPEPYYEPEITPPSVELPEESDEIPDLTPPRVEPGTPYIPSSRLRSSSAEEPPSAVRQPQPRASVALNVADPRIDHITINPELTGGIDLDKQPGDDGIQLVFEPRNPDEAFVPLSGPVSVVLLDAAEPQGDRQLVARWDLEADEVDRQIRTTSGQQGIFLTLPWPAEAPRHRHLHLFVRYETVDGGKHQAEQVIAIHPPSQLARGAWSPRENSPADSTPDDHRVRMARPEWKPFR